MSIRHLMIPAAVIMLIVAGCRQKKEEKFTPLPFPDVIPPAMMEDARSRVEFAVQHWWDRFADPQRNYPCDSLLVSGVRRPELEQKFADWAMLVNMSEFSAAVKAAGILYDKAASCERKDTSSNVFETMTGLVIKYLYDPNSPFRNEDVYGHFAEKLSQSDLVNEELKPAYAYEVQMCSLNRTGTKAADFRFSDRYGKVRSLYSVDAEYVLLFFSNPGCEACMDIIEKLKSNGLISQMISSGRLAVLNIYIDQDIDSWRSYMPIYPEEWYNGFDPDYKIRTDILYNVRAIPSLYLLDKDKKVVFKDVPEDRVLNYLMDL